MVNASANFEDNADSEKHGNERPGNNANDHDHCGGHAPSERRGLVFRYPASRVARITFAGVGGRGIPFRIVSCLRLGLSSVGRLGRNWVPLDAGCIIPNIARVI